MSVNVEQTKLVGATPEKVYAILCDLYHHKRILPDEFVNFVAESDDVFAVNIKSAFAQRTMRFRTEQVELNKSFRETEVDTGITIDFLLAPHVDGTLVTMKTNYSTSKGIMGFFESLFAPAAIRHLFESELTKLCRYALIAQVSQFSPGD